MLLIIPQFTAADFATLPATSTPPSSASSSLPVSAPPASTPAQSTAPAPKAQEPAISEPPFTGPDTPVRLRIPSINLDDPIVPVGLTADNAMSVPNGTTNNVGWYEYGPVPGEMGSAVLDAHVFAAFAKLKYVPVGADIYVLMKSGKTLHFVVRESTVYPLASLQSSTLFGRGGSEWLNLITCAGSLTPDHSTYDHRLIDFAELVSS